MDGTTVGQTRSRYLDASGPTHRISSLVLGFGQTDSQTGGISLTASGEAVLGAPVPLPAATRLPGPELVGLGSVVRRRTAAWDARRPETVDPDLLRASPGRLRGQED